MKQFYITCILSFIFILNVSFISEELGRGLEGVIVEKYYTCETGPDTGEDTLPRRAVVYRIYVDMKPGYLLQAVYGVPGHELRLETSTTFFNSRNGSKYGHSIDDGKLSEGTVAFDSWVSMGAATQSHYGILKAEDRDGSVIRRNSLEETDGLVAATKVPELTVYGLDLSFFNNNSNNSSLFSSDNGSWASFGGVKGPGEDNKVLIAQLTTSGRLSFELNLQIGTPDCRIEQYVAKNPVGKEIQFDGLVYSEEPGSKNR